MMIDDKVQFVNSGYPDFFGVKGYVEKFVNSGPDQIACLDNGRIFMTKNLEVVEQEPTNDFQRAWESVWDTICNHAPKDLFNQITQDGSGIENAVELIKVLSKHYEEPNNTASTTLQRVMTFTLNHKDIEISFEDGKIAAKDWRGNGEPVEYSFDMVEQLEEFMEAWEVMGKYHHEQE